MYRLYLIHSKPKTAVQRAYVIGYAYKVTACHLLCRSTTQAYIITLQKNVEIEFHHVKSTQIQSRACRASRLSA